LPPAEPGAQTACSCLVVAASAHSSATQQPPCPVTKRSPGLWNTHATSNPSSLHTAASPRGFAASAAGGSGDASAPAAWVEPPPLYTRVGRVEGPFTVSPRDVFAIVQAGPHQFKVTLDDVIYVEKVKGVDINDKARHTEVL
jgi:Ribosomal prokaryotic L21 protein